MSLAVAVVCAGCGASESNDAGAPAPDPVRLLAERPLLPVTYMVEDDLARPTYWGKAPGDGAAELQSCRNGDGAYRGWSHRGIEWAVPSVNQTVCVYGSGDAARETYESQSLAEVAGEDWPNFEPGSNAPTVPSNVDLLDALDAEEWEIGCGIGEPDVGCAVWTFRARYGHALVELEFLTSPGAISFEQMRDLVRSIDREITAKGRS